MPHTSRLLAATVLASALLIPTVAAAAPAAPAAKSTPAAKSARSFTVVEHADTDTTTDTGKKGDSVGDVLTFANPLFDADNTTKVGTDNGYCVRTAVGKAYECSWTNTLKGGSIMVSGPFYDKGDSLLAVVGGTGKYAGARGQMRLRALDAAASGYYFTFRLR